MSFRIALPLAALISLISLSAQAAISESVTIVKRPSAIEDSSEHNRMDKSFYLSGQLLGSAVAPVPASGVNVGYYLSRNSILQLEYATGTAERIFFKIRAQTLALNVKHFFGNSFYTKAGVAYRQLGIEDVTCILCDNPKMGDMGNVDSLAVDVAIGNQWQWETFTLGCDWIGAMIPVKVTKVHDTFSPGKEFSDKDRSELKEAWENLGKVTSAQILRFYLGLSF